MDKGFIKERDMVHQVLRERSIMSSIVTSNARYLSTLISCIDLSLLSNLIHSPFLYTCCTFLYFNKYLRQYS